MRQKLTVRSVEAIQPTTRDQIVWDSELPGFGVKVTPKGRRSYFYYYRSKDGAQRRPAIGVHGPVRPEQARSIAREWAGEVLRGGDPSVERHKVKTAPTMSQLCEKYLDEHARVSKKAASAKNDAQMIRDHILPKLGKMKVASVCRNDVAAIHRTMKATPYAANRVLALLSKMFTLAELWQMRPEFTNPAKRVPRYRENSRQRYLGNEEIRKIWETLEEPVENGVSESAAGAIRLLLLTGCRLQEVLKLEWKNVDLANGRARLQDTKTGPKWVILNAQAAALLANQMASRKANHPFVFPGQKPEMPLVNLQKPWRLIRSKLNLDDVRLHDLRHTFASVAANQGASLPMIGKLLNHTQAATTAQYAHLDANPARSVSNMVGDFIVGHEKNVLQLRLN